MQEKIIWTIGHSTRTLEEFITMLQSFDIEELADVRHFPSSRRYPNFNKDSLCFSLQQHGIGYVHMEDLGGRRSAPTTPVVSAWRHPVFHAYACYMETGAFNNGIEKLTGLAIERRTVYMCSEAVWWRCHRAMISDLLKSKQWTVQHIMAVAKTH